MKRTKSPGSRRRQAEAKVRTQSPAPLQQTIQTNTYPTLSSDPSPRLNLPALLQVRDDASAVLPEFPLVLRNNLPVRFAGNSSLLLKVPQALAVCVRLCKSFFTRPTRRYQAVRRTQSVTEVRAVSAKRQPTVDHGSCVDQIRNMVTFCKSRPLAPVALLGVLLPVLLLQHRESKFASAQLVDRPILTGSESSQFRHDAKGDATVPDGSGIETGSLNEVTEQLNAQAAALPPSTANDPFKLPARMRHAVAFWQRVFGQWDAGDVVLHDTEHLGIVYEVIDLPEGAGGARLTPRDQRVVDQRKRVLSANLNDLEYRLRSHLGLSKEQQRLYRLISAFAGRSAVEGAAERVRIQRGMRNSFRQGLAASGRYEKLFRQVFRENGLPEDLVFLAHVESAFTSTAKSPVGAIGVWQFMPETGKRFLRITNSIDERYDPVLATRGAARYFALAFNKLEDWGLAVTSFNYGLSGMLKAKAECGASFERVVQCYNAPNFGFASKNYYAEFLAIRSIVRDLDKYFPNGINFAPPLPHKRVRLTRSAPAQDVAKAHGLALSELVELNPAWTKAAAQGRVALPAEAEIWVPANAVVKDAAPPGMIARVEGGSAAEVSQ